MIFDAQYEYIEYTPTGTISATWTNSLSTTKSWETRIECIGCDAYSQTWNVGSWDRGDGTIEEANDGFAVYGTNTTAVAGFEGDGT